MAKRVPRRLASAQYSLPFQPSRNTSPVCGEKALAIGRVWKNTVQKEVDLNVLKLSFFFQNIFVYLFVFDSLNVSYNFRYFQVGTCVCADRWLRP